MRENYTKKLAHLRDTHAKQWDEFLQLDAQQRRQQQVHQQMAASGFAGYKQHNYSEYEGGSVNSHYEGANLAALDSRSKYPNHMENYPSRPHGNFGEFQRQRRDDYGNAYKRY